MGGHADGALAAQCVMDVAARIFADEAQQPAAQLIQRIGLESHLAIQSVAPDLSERQQPRTTVVCAVVDGPNVLFAHAGDSRAYHLRRGEIVHVTRDHSAVAMMVRRGDIRPQDARHHPMRNQVTRCLGGGGPPPALELTPCPPLRPGDTLLLCSDGFWDPLEPDELGSNIELTELAQRAVARNPGSADNCTALRIRFESV